MTHRTPPGSTSHPGPSDHAVQTSTLAPSFPLRLLLIGGGHAVLPALMAAERWTRAGVEVTLLNDHPYLYYSGMVPEHLGGVYGVDEVRIDLRARCTPRGVRFVLGTAAEIDRAGRKVVTTDGQALPFSVAAFDIGARNPGASGGAVDTKPLHRIETLNERIRAVLADPQAHLRLVVAGGGAAGVEVVLNLAARFHGAGRADALAATIVEPGPRLLAGFPAGAAAFTTTLLRRRGVRIRTGSPVATVHADHVVLGDGTALPADLVLWATGSVGQPLFAVAGFPCDDRGFVRVGTTLQVAGDPWMLAAGDCAVVDGYEGLPRIGVHAVKQGPVLRDNLDRALAAARAGHAPRGLRTWRPYPIAPLILSTGTEDALYLAPPLWLHGRPFLRLKHLVDQRWMRRYHPRWETTSLWQMLDAHHAG